MPSEKHTPGPWFLRHPEIKDEQGVEIASVNCYRDCLPEEEANARLIAAAPDLLAACEALDEFQRDYHANTRDDMPGNEYYATRLMAIVNQARAALAKTRET